MALLTLRDVTLAFDEPPLLDQVGLNVERGERLCLVGRNGTGKSTLFRIITGEQRPDSGEIARERGAVIALLPQEVPQDLVGPVFDVVAGGLQEKGKLLSEYHDVSSKLGGKNDEAMLDRLESLQHQLEMTDGWNAHAEVERVITHLRLDADALCESLSAGTKRRVLLARALVSKPDLLLLDEPTNHLDIDTICWLETYLLENEATLFFITHDRQFVRKLATRIVEIDRGKLSSWACSYDAYLTRKEAALEAEEKQRALFEKRLAQEEAWLRKGIRARRTRNEGRVKALLRMREQRQTFRDRIGSIHLEAQEAQRTGKLVIEAEDLAFSYGDLDLVRDFSTTIIRGDKVGIIGQNGSGKTTLLRLLLKELEPKSGSVFHGTNLSIAYFDQLRAQLNETASVQDNIADGNPFLTVNGVKRHVVGYLEDFLFESSRIRSPVSVLSGGERNRLMLAKLFALPSNVLVLDEPTNDLDADSLELLEDMLVQYEGTVLLVSHDREFLNHVVTSTIALEGNGRVAEYIGGYDDWIRQRPRIEASVPETKKVEEKPRREKVKLTGPQKLTFKEKQELEQLPSRIEALEQEKHDLFHSMADPKVYEQSGGVAAVQARLASVEQELTQAYDRWAELEERR